MTKNTANIFAKNQSHWGEMAELPTGYKREDGVMCHESLFRSFQALQEVRWMCKLGTPPPVILRFLEFVDTYPHTGEVRDD